MQRFALLISYLGTGTIGWQKQKGQANASGRPSIQGTLEQAIKKVSGESLSLVGSGRTDSGVHALGQVAHFTLKGTKREWTTDTLLKGINSELPRSIRILGCEKVDIEFHALRSAVKKTYVYYLQQGPAALPQHSRTVAWKRRVLDFEAMKSALESIIGTHDFKAYQSAGAVPGPTIRTVFSAELRMLSASEPLRTELAKEYFLIEIRLTGNGFLKQMVRSIVGTLTEIGEGRRPSTDLHALTISKNRQAVGKTAPAHGLWLEQVEYPNLKFL